jgi:uncharacterized protein (TIGR02452 family)
MRSAKLEKTAEQTLSILSRGQYDNSRGEVVTISGSLRRAVDGTVLYKASDEVTWRKRGSHDTDVTLECCSTIESAKSLVSAGHNTVALNFGSAKNPGGGFLRGAQAQEESLARSSGLYLCLRNSEMYRRNRASKDPIYLNDIVYSPCVPFFRDDEGRLLDDYFECAVITAPAVNSSLIRERFRERLPEVEGTMRNRISRVLSVAALHGHDAIVLGAWGCGVFGNDPKDVAGWFADAIRSRFDGVFRRIEFAILDDQPMHTISAFRSALFQLLDS